MTELKLIEGKDFAQLQRSILDLKNYIKDKEQKADTETFLTTEQVCKLLSISPKTLQNYRNRRLIPFSQFGSKVWFKKSDVISFIEENRITSSKKLA